MKLRVLLAAVCLFVAGLNHAGEVGGGDSHVYSGCIADSDGGLMMS